MSGGEFFFVRIILAPITVTWWICAGYIFSYLKTAFGSFWGFVIFGVGILAYGLPLLLHFLRFALVFLGTYFDRFSTFEDLVEDSTWFSSGGRSALTSSSSGTSRTQSTATASPTRTKATSNVPHTTSNFVMQGRSQPMSTHCPTCRKTTRHIPAQKENWSGRYHCNKCGSESYHKGAFG